MNFFEALGKIALLATRTMHSESQCIFTMCAEEQGSLLHLFYIKNERGVDTAA